MLIEATFLTEQAQVVTQCDVLADGVIQRAFVRSIEIIGEAAKRVPHDFRKAHPEIDWRAITGMRDRLVHGYFGIDLEIVWNVASVEAPTLKAQLERLLADDPDAQD